MYYSLELIITVQFVNGLIGFFLIPSVSKSNSGYATEVNSPFTPPNNLSMYVQYISSSFKYYGIKFYLFSLIHIIVKIINLKNLYFRRRIQATEDYEGDAHFDTSFF